MAILPILYYFITPTIICPFPGPFTSETSPTPQNSKVYKYIFVCTGTSYKLQQAGRRVESENACILRKHGPPSAAFIKLNCSGAAGLNLEQYQTIIVIY